MNATARQGMLNIFISTGEVSGDIAAAHLAVALRRRCPDANLYGIGGPRMASAGVRVAFESVHLGVIGISEPLRSLPDLFRSFARTRSLLQGENPDLAILVGYEGLKFLIAWWLRSRGIPTVCYFPPRIWLWHRFARPIARSFDLVLASFPQEKLLYEQAGGNVVFVGHYLRDLLEPVSPEAKERARLHYGIPAQARLIGLLPGSRRQEVHALTPILFQCAALLRKRDSTLQFIVPLAEKRYTTFIKTHIERFSLRDCVGFSDDSHEAMRACDLILTASGTATLEASLLAVPMIIFYRISLLNLAVVRLAQASGLVGYRDIGLPNLLAGKRIVPELHQNEATASELAARAWKLLDEPEAQTLMVKELRSLAMQLGGQGSLDRVVNSILEACSKNGT
ncbi:MAG: lipid-A-disaccharide synthase [Acidobacteria bacterium]|nr:lipid-A-disaccharide synthase [Acidobacteriota bacterium]